MSLQKLVVPFIFPFFVGFLISDMKGVSLSLDRQRVNLSVYYESLSPPCANFLVKNLVSVFNNGLITIINLRLLPWGNASIIKSNNAVVCQHGPDECTLNTIEACAINSWRNVDMYYGFIYCIEFLVIEGRHKDWQSCFSSLGLPSESVLSCNTSTNGTKLEITYANETASVVPRPTFVPWVVVNGKPIRNDYGNFTRYVCNAYKGTSLPDACKSIPPIIGSARKPSPVHPDCYAGKPKNLTSVTLDEC